jgi:hypothetical protein
MSKNASPLEVTQMLKKNVGSVDSAIRLLAGIAALSTGVLLLGALEGSIFGLAAVAVGLIGVVTGATRRCPTYVLFGMDTLDEPSPTTQPHTSRP